MMPQNLDVDMSELPYMAKFYIFEHSGRLSMHILGVDHGRKHSFGRNMVADTT